MTLRTALRNLHKSPRLSFAAVACISLGAAATSAIATLVTATLLRPLPFPDAERLVRIWFDDGAGNNHVSLSIPAVLSHAVARRSHEIGLRVALGAGRPDVVRLVLANGMRPLGIGGRCRAGW